MIGRRHILLFTMAFPALHACGPAPTDPGPSGVTVEEAEMLDEAAEKLDDDFANPPPLTEEAADDR
ncbi:MAG: hypothetical protein IPH79_06250 [Sphingomonadales bacterium]|nr:hypothetical protein [Sphingomonadales bacterium]